MRVCAQPAQRTSLMQRRPTTWLAVLAVWVTTASSCTGGGADPIDPTRTDAVALKVAFVGDLSFDGATQLVSPAQGAIELAFAQAVERGDLDVVPELVPMDTEGDAAVAGSFATEIANDPTFVAVIAAPFWDEPVAFGDRLDAAAVPTVSLSTMGEELSQRGWTRWWRAVAPGSDIAASVTAATRGTSEPDAGVCLVGDDTAHAAALVTDLRVSLEGRIAVDLAIAGEDGVPAAVAAIAAAGCRTVTWTGFAPLASALLRGLVAEGIDARFVGADALKDDRFLADSGGAADGTVVVCACVDVTTSAAIVAQRFVHDFQSAVGSSPGVAAVEGWDVAGMLLAAIVAGASDRMAVARHLSSSGTYDGLAGSYAFTVDGELDRRSSRVVAFRAEGLRWLPVGRGAGASELPVHTRGYLAVGSCRVGRPFRYRRDGRLVGFEVELISLVARRLGLTPVWSDLACDDALDAVQSGRLDAAITPRAAVTAGTPISRVTLVLDAALTVRGDLPPTSDPLDRLDGSDVVGVVREAGVEEWVGASVVATGARTVQLARDRAYARLARGSLDAVADLEYTAWASVERRPGLWVRGGYGTGEVDVIATAGTEAEVLAAIDRVLGRLMASGRYAKLFGAYFPGAPVPAATGGSGDPA